MHKKFLRTLSVPGLFGLAITIAQPSMSMDYGDAEWKQFQAACLASKPMQKSRSKDRPRIITSDQSLYSPLLSAAQKGNYEAMKTLENIQPGHPAGLKANSKQPQQARNKNNLKQNLRVADTILKTTNDGVNLYNNLQGL